MSSQRLVAFLRGINLGRRRLKMEELQGHFEALGLEDVATYLASGNVLFRSGAGALDDLEVEIETQLEGMLGYEVDTLIPPVQEIPDGLSGHPPGEHGTGGLASDG